MGLQLEVVTGLGNSGGGTQLGVKVNLALAYNLSTYPNPFDSELTFDFFLPNEEQIHLSVFDCFGRLILEKNESRSKGVQSIKLNNLSVQPVGLYWYSLKAGAQLFFGKISKQ
jgi:Secretion system C-terminal sorting domain